MVELIDGTKIELLGVGTRVRHKVHGLVGKVAGHEYVEPGKLSAVPYKIYWDDDDMASKIMGWMYLYPPHEFLETVAQEGL